MHARATQASIVGSVVVHAATATYKAKYTSDLAETVLGFSGRIDVSSEDDNVGIHAPSLWLEFSLQSNKSTGMAETDTNFINRVEAAYGPINNIKTVAMP